jgi:hypothetical protein
MGSLLRTWLPGGSIEFRQTWKRRATPSGSPYWAHIPSGRPTRGKGSTGPPGCPGSAWPTPKSSDSDNGQRSPEGAAAEFERKGTGADLPTVATLAGWPTCNATGHKGPSQPPGRRPPGDNDLPSTALLAGWSTPRALELGQVNSRDDGRALSAQVRQVEVSGWPTATAQDAAGARSATAGNAEGRAEKHHLGVTLTDAALLTGWVTPTVMDATNANTPETWAARQQANPNTGGKTAAKDLAVQAQLAGYPTPAAHEFEPRDLEAMLARRAGQKAMGRNGNGFGLTLGMMAPSSFTAPTARRVSSRLNPGFSLWLQGYPRTWTLCSPGWKSAEWAERTLGDYYASLAATAPAG